MLLNLLAHTFLRKEDIMDDNSIAINKNKLYKLINVKQYEKAKSYLYEEQNNIYQMAISRLKPYIDHGIIYEEEVDVFIQIIEKNIIYNMLKDEDNIRMSMLGLNELIDKKNRLDKLKKIRRC